MKRFGSLSPSKVFLSPEARRKLKGQIKELKEQQQNEFDKEFVEDDIIRAYLVRNHMTVQQLRELVNKIQTTWRQVTALILFRSVVVKAKRLTDVMLNKHQSHQMHEYKNCLHEYRRHCKQLIVAHNEKDHAINRLTDSIHTKIETETANFDAELDALSREYQHKLQILSNDIKTNCNHPEKMQQWLQNQQIDEEYLNRNACDILSSIGEDMKLFDRYMSSLRKLADEYKSETDKIKEYKKRSEVLLFSRLQNRLQVVVENKDAEIKQLELEKNKWDKRYRLMRDITGFYRNCWLHYFASDDKAERQQIEEQMSNREVLYQIYQNILDKIDIEQRKRKEEIIAVRYKNVKKNKLTFTYQSPKWRTPQVSELLSGPSLKEDETVRYRTAEVMDRLRERKMQPIAQTDVKLPPKISKYVHQSFFQEINQLAAFSRFEILNENRP